MDIVISILIMIFILGLLVLSHEWGHFIAARIFKVRVNEFSIFMGPKLFQRKSKKTGTLYTLRAIPVGGFCAMQGEEESDEGDDAFCNKPWYQRAVILVAGALMNFIVAIVAITVVFSFTGYDTTEVSLVGDNGPISFSGMKVGDVVYKYNGDRLLNPMDYDLYVTAYGNDLDKISFNVKKKDGTKVKYTLKREIKVENSEVDGEKKTTAMSADINVYATTDGDEVYVGNYKSSWDNGEKLVITHTLADGTYKVFTYAKDESGCFGTTQESYSADAQLIDSQFTADTQESPISENTVLSYNPYKYGFSFTYGEDGNIFQCLGKAVKYNVSLVKSVLNSLKWLVTGRLGIDAMAGPIGLTSMVGEVVEADIGFGYQLLTLINLLALISANLGAFNLLPIPGLDGGKLIFVIVELIRGGKKIPPEKEAVVSLIFMALLIILSIVIAGNDIFRLVG